MPRFFRFTALAVLALALTGCTATASTASITVTSERTPAAIAVTRVADLPPTATVAPSATPLSTSTPRAVPITPTANPTPRANEAVATLGPNWYPLWLTVAPGEDAGLIAAAYGIDLDVIRAVNQLESGQVLQPGQVIVVPQYTERLSPSDKLIPDSGLVNGPGAVGFDVQAFASRQGGYLVDYRERVNGVLLSGPDIVALIAANYSVNPRLLLALLEYHSGWILDPLPPAEARRLPMAYGRGQGGLYHQLAWAARTLNNAFYSHTSGQLQLLLLADGSRVALHPELNAGTVAVQTLLAETHTAAAWQASFDHRDFARVYHVLFGDPFARAVEPLLPLDLSQPRFDLPWSVGETWYYVGGPHPSFGTGTPWGAIDFAPPGNDVGCYVSDRQITAVADGVIARTGFGQVVLDLDGDGNEQTGWVIVYLHVENLTKVGEGFEIERGGYIGFPSCDGGFAEGTHVHLARKYNGVWLLADGRDHGLPFQLGDWTPERGDSPYAGFLTNLRTGESVEACDCRRLDLNAVERRE